jgi:hypothetical protein
LQSGCCVLGDSEEFRGVFGGRDSISSIREKSDAGDARPHLSAGSRNAPAMTVPSELRPFRG